MKLLFCTHCHDIFLLNHDWRYCKCTQIGGRYLPDGHHAEILDPGEIAVSLAISNPDFAEALNRFSYKTEQEDYEDYYEDCSFQAWVRPNSGPGNPRTNVIEEGHE